jgi:galactokinase/mevalonate kinase-like predicted kinase
MRRDSGRGAIVRYPQSLAMARRVFETERGLLHVSTSLMESQCGTGKGTSSWLIVATTVTVRSHHKVKCPPWLVLMRRAIETERQALVHSSPIPVQ